MKIARLSGWLAQKLGPAIKTSADLAYTFALFRDAGILLMLNRYPDYYTTLEEANNYPERLFTQIEEDRHATSHALRSLGGCRPTPARLFVITTTSA